MVLIYVLLAVGAGKEAPLIKADFLLHFTRNLWTKYHKNVKNSLRGVFEESGAELVFPPINL
jgi:hypothetical protein